MKKTIKEVKERIEKLKNDRQNYFNLRSYLLDHDIPNVENDANLNRSLYHLVSDSIDYYDTEIERLTSIVDSAEVEI